MARRHFQSALGAALLSGVLGCGAEPKAPVAETPSTEVVCGRAPSDLAGSLSQPTQDDIQLYVQTGGNDAAARHLRASFGQEAMTCDALSYLACSSGLRAGGSQGQAMELNRMAASACKAPAPKVAQATPPPASPPPPPPKRPSAPIARPKPRPAPKPPPPTPKSAAKKWRPGTFLAQAVSRVVGNALEVQKSTKYAFDSTGSSVLGAFLNRGANIDMTRPLKGGVQYAILGGGSDSVKNLNIEVFDAQGKRIAADTSTDKAPVVEFRVPKDGNYKLVVTLSDSKASGSFAAVAIMRDAGGYNVPPKNLIQSFGNALQLTGLVSKRLREVSGGKSSVVFHGNGDWCFYGTVMENNQALNFRGIDAEGPAVVLAATDGEAKDVDLDVKDSRSNKSVGKDDGDDNTPVVAFKGDARRSYVLRMSTRKAPAPSMVSIFLLKVNK